MSDLEYKHDRKLSSINHYKRMIKWSLSSILISISVIVMDCGLIAFGIASPFMYICMGTIIGNLIWSLMQHIDIIANYRFERELLIFLERVIQEQEFRDKRVTNIPGNISGDPRFLAGETPL